MIFFVGLLWAEEPAEVPIADQKVIHYLLDRDEGNEDKEEDISLPLQTKAPQPSVDLPAGLEAQIEEHAKPELQKIRPQAFPELSAPWWWGVLFAALLLGALRLFIGKQKKTIGSIKVHSRSFFGHEGSITVVEVKDAEDNPRVFLLGMHSKGSPQFLADLSAPLPFPELGNPQVRQNQVSNFEEVLPKEIKGTVTPVMEDSEEEEEKEALVEQILRMRETKTKTSDDRKDSLEKRDRWAEGFHEVLRK